MPQFGAIERCGIIGAYKRKDGIEVAGKAGECNIV
jgi:hypothetical protein